jgi:hypothetical protein
MEEDHQDSEFAIRPAPLLVTTDHDMSNWDIYSTAPLTGSTAASSPGHERSKHASRHLQDKLGTLASEVHKLKEDKIRLLDRVDAMQQDKISMLLQKDRTSRLDSSKAKQNVSDCTMKEEEQNLTVPWYEFEKLQVEFQHLEANIVWLQTVNKLQQDRIVDLMWF